MTDYSGKIFRLPGDTGSGPSTRRGQLPLASLRLNYIDEMYDNAAVEPDTDTEFDETAGDFLHLVTQAAEKCLTYSGGSTSCERISAYNDNDGTPFNRNTCSGTQSISGGSVPTSPSNAYSPPNYTFQYPRLLGTRSGTYIVSALQQSSGFRDYESHVQPPGSTSINSGNNVYPGNIAISGKTHPTLGRGIFIGLTNQLAVGAVGSGIWPGFAATLSVVLMEFPSGYGTAPTFSELLAGTPMSVSSLSANSLGTPTNIGDGSWLSLFIAEEDLPLSASDWAIGVVCKDITVTYPNPGAIVGSTMTLQVSNPGMVLRAAWDDPPTGTPGVLNQGYPACLTFKSYPDP